MQYSSACVQLDLTARIAEKDYLLLRVLILPGFGLIAEFLTVKHHRSRLKVVSVDRIVSAVVQSCHNAAPTAT